MNTYCYIIYYILLETVWWALSNTSLIMWISPVVHEILANKAFIVADGLISELFIIDFVHPTYMQIALIQGFLVQLSLWKSVHWLWRYKLNEVCDTIYFLYIVSVSISYSRRSILMWFLYSTHCFLKNILFISHSL